MIHNSSVIDKKAKISKKIKIGPFCYVGPNVELKDDVELISNVHIEGNTSIGKGTRIFPFASLGTQPQDLKFKGEKNNLVIGENNLIREYVTINIVYHALNSKETHESDAKLIQLLGSSLTYVDLDNTKFEGEYSDLLNRNFTKNEKDYFLDMACLAIWEDKTLDYSETDYIFGLGKDLGKSKKEVESELDFVMNFFEKNKDKIAYLSNKNLAVQFYDGMSKNVGKLILRNSKRLKKELTESRELVALLSKSTVKDLSDEEKKKVQNQLLDIFKSIPSSLFK